MIVLSSVTGLQAQEGSDENLDAMNEVTPSEQVVEPDISEPAGDESGGVETVGDDAMDDDPVVGDPATTATAEGMNTQDSAGNGASAEVKQTAAASGEESGDDTWESYTGNQSTVARDVTGGMRVEDIVEPLNDYAYAAFGKADPFIAPYFRQKNIDFSLDVPIVSVLQTFELKDLQIAGIWQSYGGERKALMMTLDKKIGVEIVKGDPIGRKAGKVMEIRPESVVVREYYITRDGTREFEDVELLLPNEFSGKVEGTTMPVVDPNASAAPTGAAVKVTESIKGTTIEKTEATIQPPATATGTFLPTKVENEGTRRAVTEELNPDGLNKTNDIEAPATTLEKIR
jgi:Tfp pilus assembly protein PilP